MTDPVYINGVGLVSSLGWTLAQSAEKYAASTKNFIRNPSVIGPDGLPLINAPVIPIDEERDPVLRLRRLVKGALDDLLAQCGGPLDVSQLIVCVPAWITQASGALLPKDWPELQNLAPHADMITVLSSENTVLGCIADAARSVSLAPRQDVLFVAVDSFLHSVLIDQLVAANRLLCSAQPHGVVPSEAAVALRLNGENRVNFALPTALIDGFWTSHEDQDVTQPDTMLGDALAQVLQEGAQAADTDRLILDLNGERWRSEELGVAAPRIADLVNDTLADLETPLSYTGFSGMASAGVMLALMLASPTDEEKDRPERVLLSASAIWGRRDAVGLRHYSSGQFQVTEGQT